MAEGIGGRLLTLTALVLLGAVLAGYALQRHAARDRLRSIVQEQCVPDWRTRHDPAPCSSVTLLTAGADAQGYAVLHDRKGGAHFLLIPTRTVGGIESPAVQDPGTPNYFAAAWQARTVLATVTGVLPPRSAIALAVNQRRARSQDQLHIHMSCLKPEIAHALQQAHLSAGSTWTPLQLQGYSYRALRLMGEELAPTNPVTLLAAGLPGARAALADYTLLLAGADFSEGPGFVLLAADRAPGAELLLDASCALAR
jgi:CDP-diacylglycerol pyrophosphatase